ncbi:MAG: hypothetical protein ACR2LL_10845 [Nitrosopumilus sp.]|uniref:hypothetical protein n=1 Tax=Nitrosopumilus sp. TaxID=2024843 RepID=UPI00292E3E38|nr:hypothetical protein [Nitrosopumilus sp.]
MVEEEYYQTRSKITTMSQGIFPGKPSEQTQFWNNATKYTLVSQDEGFVEEVAYMMVTLHRTGA